MGCTAEAAKCVVHLGRSYPREDPSCSGLVPTAKTTLNPAHVRPERRALHNEPRLDDTIKPDANRGAHRAWQLVHQGFAGPDHSAPAVTDGDLEEVVLSQVPEGVTRLGLVGLRRV